MDKDIQIISVTNRRLLRDFIYLPRILHRDHSKWVPPIYAEEWKYFNPGKNPAYAYCDVELAICLFKNKLAGRIMGVINHRYNSIKRKKPPVFQILRALTTQ